VQHFLALRFLTQLKHWVDKLKFPTDITSHAMSVFWMPRLVYAAWNSVFRHLLSPSSTQSLCAFICQSAAWEACFKYYKTTKVAISTSFVPPFSAEQSKGRVTKHLIHFNIYIKSKQSRKVLKRYYRLIFYPRFRPFITLKNLVVKIALGVKIHS